MFAAQKLKRCVEGCIEFEGLSVVARKTEHKMGRKRMDFPVGHL